MQSITWEKGFQNNADPVHHQTVLFLAFITIYQHRLHCVKKDKMKLQKENL